MPIRQSITLILTSILLSLCFVSTKAQEDTTNLDSLQIWNASKKYIYDAFYIDSIGDTITKEQIIIQPIRKMHKYKIAEDQIVLKYIYNYSEADSARLAPNPVNGNEWTQQNGSMKWLKTVREGAIETNGSVWLHPFRMNQYVLTEIAPFPGVRFPLHINKKWDMTLTVFRGWGIFKGKHKQTMIVTDKKDYTLQIGQMNNCWVIFGLSTHKNLGTSQVEYIYHEQYGFLSMQYKFYNGQRITFILSELITDS